MAVVRAVPIVSKQKAVKNSKQVEKTLQFEDNKKSKKTQNSSVINDAVETLKTLGFTSQEVYKEVFKIAKNNDCTTEEIVKEFLKKK
jgi:Holliday junction resolvasome RuvABC DNA-binding subunit